MKVKLIKKKEGWYNLYQDSIGISSTHEELQGYNLSLKNCQAIERGYDLYELIDRITPKDKFTVNASERRNGYLKGFQKCLELMGDKKFSEDDVRKVIFLCCNDADSTEETIFESLQQTEWDVTFNPEELDADGCLILKVKSE